MQHIIALVIQSEKSNIPQLINILIHKTTINLQDLWLSNKIYQSLIAHLLNAPKERR